MNDLMQYIDINPIVKKAKELDCPYIAIIGGKGTGKTYGCIDYALRDFFKDNSQRPFCYVAALIRPLQSQYVVIVGSHSKIL